MRILADTNLFIAFCRRLPMPKPAEAAFESPDNERCLSPISVLELFRLWRKQHVPGNPDDWLGEALPDWTILPVNVPIARQSVLWEWEHQDPADRLLAATAREENVELWHTDTVLKSYGGFPQRYFKHVPDA